MPQELQIALIAAAAALAGSLLGSWLTRTTEHNQWVRNQKLEVYERVHTLALDLLRIYRRSPASTDKGIPDALEPFSAFERLPIDLFASKKVSLCHTLLIDELFQLTDAAVEPGRPKFEDAAQEAEDAVHALQKAMRDDLRLKD